MDETFFLLYVGIEPDMHATTISYLNTMFSSHEQNELKKCDGEITIKHEYYLNEFA